MDKISMIKKYRWPIVINEQGFRRLYDELQKLLDDNAEISIKIQYTDKSSIETESLDTLINDENRDGRKIRIVSIHAVGPNKEIKIDIGQMKVIKEQLQYSPDITVDITGPDRQWVFVAGSQIEDRLKSYKSTRLSSFKIALIAAITISFITYLVVYLLRVQLHFFYSLDLKSNTNQLNTYFFALMFGLAILTIIPVMHLYKDITFAIGTELDLHQKRIRTRSQLFWVVIVGVPLTVLVTIILNQFN